MAEDKTPLCDRHHFRMWPAESSFLPAVVFNCASLSCRRYYGKHYGHFNLLFLEQIDSDNHSMNSARPRGIPRLYSKCQTCELPAREPEFTVLALL
jgi:hypothetical protein